MTRVWSTPIFVIAIVYFIIDGVFSYVTRPMRRTIVFGFIAGTCIVAPAFAQTPYDGLWNVTILTRAGSCEPSARYPLTVTDGKVSGAADVSGSIGREGIVKVSIRGAYANGRLNGSGGSGKWNGASGGIACSGRWEASRQ